VILYIVGEVIFVELEGGGRRGLVGQAPSVSAGVVGFQFWLREITSRQAVEARRRGFRVCAAAAGIQATGNI
jgi:hypothetical protein